VIRIAVCDDSRTYAHALARVLQADGDVEVVGSFGTAEQLIAALANLRPDLVTMDLELPGMDGIEATRQIMRVRPIPIVVLSSHADEQATEALAAGAVDVLHKGEVGLRDVEGPEGLALRRRVRRLSRLRVTAPPVAPPRAREPARAVVNHAVRAIGIAASTGGPSALREVLSHLPAVPAVPVIVVQHMTAGFTEGLARWLDQAVPPPVRLATEGTIATPGVWIAPDGAHLTIDRSLALHLDRRDDGAAHRPGADVLFTSLASALAPDVAVAVLTGMGDDGARGVGAVVAAGGLAIAQDEATSAVAGMPRAAVAAGARLVLSLAEIGPTLASLPARRRTAV
jgi:two-component system chemotaxis response regulator CheB